MHKQCVPGTLSDLQANPHACVVLVAVNYSLLFVGYHGKHVLPPHWDCPLLHLHLPLPLRRPVHLCCRYTKVIQNSCVVSEPSMLSPLFAFWHTWTDTHHDELLFETLKKEKHAPVTLSSD